jgi:hypothetical protein
MKVCALTTNDNPYDPFTQFDDWYAFDILKGYGTCSYLGRIALTSPELLPEDQAIANELAIDEICKFDYRGIYKKVEKEV